MKKEFRRRYKAEVTRTIYIHLCQLWLKTSQRTVSLEMKKNGKQESENQNQTQNNMSDYVVKISNITSEKEPNTPESNM